jgi:hypothetical protein
MNRFIVSLLLGALAAGVFCSKKPAPPLEQIMARVNGRIISEREFIERAEYTIRPPYAKFDNYVHKKIVLNSLIAEALLAQDAGDSTSLAKNDHFQLFIQGQKEQAMRQMFFQKHFYEPIKLDKKEVRKVYDLAGRTYEIHYVSSKNKTLSDLIGKRVLQERLPFDQVVLQYTGMDSLPSRKVAFELSEIAQVRQALFEQNVQKGQVIGPIQIENEYLWISVQGWRERISLNTQDVQNRSQDVLQHLTFKYAGEAYEKYVRKLMKGKRVDFNKETFVELVNTLGPLFFPKTGQKESDIKQLVWNKQSPNELPLDSLSTQLERLKDKPLMSESGKIWKVGDLDRELLLHPLLFRKKHLQKGEFAEQLKLALVDIIKDKYITAKASKEGFETNPYVVARTDMWRDAYLANEARNEYLASIGVLNSFEKEYNSIIAKDLNPRIDALQKKYSNTIEINTDLLEKTQLTRIDLFAMYADQPYPIIVPPFPMLTTDDRLDYGKKLASP